jgi:hypothetical protein
MDINLFRILPGCKKLELWMLLLLSVFLVLWTVAIFWNSASSDESPIELIRIWAVYSCSACATIAVLYLQLNALREKRFAIALVILFTVLPVAYVGTRYTQYMLLGLPSPPRINPFMYWQPSSALIAVCALISIVAFVYAIYFRGAKT